MSASLTASALIAAHTPPATWATTCTLAACGRRFPGRHLNCPECGDSLVIYSKTRAVPA